MNTMADGYLIKLEERVDDEYEIITFVGGHSQIPEPKNRKLFFHACSRINSRIR